MIDSAQQMIETGRAARNAGDLNTALEQYSAAVEALRATDAPLRLAHTIRHVADIQTSMGHLAEAEASYAQALAIYRDDPATGTLDLGNTLRGYALLREQTGDQAAAHAMWSETLELYRKVGVQAGVDEAERRLAHFETGT